MSGEPLVEQMGDVWSCVSGSCYRAVNPAYQDAALLGSRLAGRYPEPNQRPLYLSSSPEGVDAAMIAHAQRRVDELVVLKFHVEAHNIVDPGPGRPYGRCQPCRRSRALAGHCEKRRRARVVEGSPAAGESRIDRPVRSFS